MRVKVKLFASLRETLGFAERDLELSEDLTLKEVWKIVAGERGPATEVLMAVNMDYAQPETKINDGDEVAFFPPVTGG